MAIVCAGLGVSCKGDRAGARDAGADSLPRWSAVDAKPPPIEDPTSDAARALCQRMCATLDGLACPRAADCRGGCESSLAGPCGPVWLPYYECVDRLPVDALLCNEGGRPDTTPGACAESHAAVRQCLLAPRG